MRAWWKKSPSRGTVALNMKPVRGPWGGSSPFVEQLELALRDCGFHVQYDLGGAVDAIVLIDPREAKNKPFGPTDIAAYRKRHPDVRVLHRVNECDQRKGTDFMDRMLREANAGADFTVFISDWLRDYHAARWFDSARPHTVIYNGADDRVFYPARRPPPADPFIVVTHHWSNHPLKGFDVYQQVDAALAEGRLPGFEFRVIGRWPDGMTWRAAKTHPPAHGVALANQLRACHAYLTASRWEPCGMHHVEGAQCGLPLAAHREGGGIVEAAERHGLVFDSDPVAALLDLRSRYAALRRTVLAERPSGAAMARAYVRAVERMLEQNG
ncbi:MAG TPA: hypothetical protein PKE12_14565 [Kiritimatiellia bacterium]|nr:hypothetical protein [Kiritimatiellia bacterium]